MLNLLMQHLQKNRGEGAPLAFQRSARSLFRRPCSADECVLIHGMDQPRLNL